MRIRRIASAAHKSLAALAIRAAQPETLNATHLRFLIHKIGQCHKSLIPEERIDTGESWSNQNSAVLIADLLRHARTVWPGGLENVAILATRIINHHVDDKTAHTCRNVQELSALYNHMLTWISQPPSLRPFQSVPHQEKAQLSLVRKMTTFKPHLPITRDGFRALATVQLARRKTEEERKWANLKTLSWPPWKEELLGIEVDTDQPGKFSRASLILAFMSEAGYSHQEWERAARILAGWDTDGSPTMQIRTFAVKPPQSDIPHLPVSSSSAPSWDHGTTWAARIAATRTVKEAWACFTSYLNLNKRSYHAAPHQAMLLRLIYARKERIIWDSDQTTVLPGDGREAWAEPTSPRDFLYVPSDPPDIRQFWQFMRSKKIRPGGYLVSALLDGTDNYEDATQYLVGYGRTKRAIGPLTGTSIANFRNVRRAVKAVGNRVAASWISLLCRVQIPAGKYFMLPDTRLCHDESIQNQAATTTDSFFFAQHLVEALATPYRPIWYALLGGFRDLIVSTHCPQAVESLVLAWLEKIWRMNGLGIDFDAYGALIILQTLEEVVIQRCRVFKTHLPWWVPGDDPRPSWALLGKFVFFATIYGESLQRRKFDWRRADWLPLTQASTSGDPLAQIPIDLPSPAMLHLMIRILGMCGDHASLLTLLAWMDTHATGLSTVADQLANSAKLKQHTMTAVRYFLEFAWQDEDFALRAAARGEWSSVQRQKIAQARNIIQRHPHDWGSWPTDEELHAYHAADRSKARRMRKAYGLAHVSFQTQ